MNSAFSTGPVVTPDSLPEKPAGWTRRMTMHMSVKGGGIGTYSIHNPAGERMPFGYQYNTAPGGLTGFVLEGHDGVLTWAQLVEAWPAYLASKKGPAP